jgi:guanylate kinase
VQGARQVRETMPEAVRIFIEPPTADELRKRLEGRGTDDPETIERRLEEARKELRARDEFGHRVTNDDIDRAANELAGIVRSALDR